MRKHLLANLLLLCFSTAVTLVASEYAFRWVLFSGLPMLERFKQPYHFAYTYEENYGKLYHLWGGKYQGPATPHPLLGWVGYFSRETYLHDDEGQLGERQPILLYGDSFAQCASAASGECFHQILNSNPSFAGSRYMLNYGVGGYGLDQMLLLLRETLPLYKRAMAIVGVFTDDLDRSVMGFRIGQKPYFELDGRGLQLHGVPIDPDPVRYLNDHPVDIRSYLLQFVLHSNHAPRVLVDYLAGRAIQKIESIGTRLLEGTIEHLRARNIPFLFIIFSSLDEMQSDTRSWREALLVRTLEEHRVPFIASKELIRKAAQEQNKKVADFFLAEDMHPTAEQNRIISSAISDAISRGTFCCAK
ncbi:MAG: hypothetical protein U0361_22840 [Nitrospiraceae bacterium]